MSRDVTGGFAHFNRNQMIPPDQSWEGSGSKHWNLKKTWPKWTQSLCQFLLFTSELVVYTTSNHMEGKVFCEALLMCVCLHTSWASHDWKRDDVISWMLLRSPATIFWIHSYIFSEWMNEWMNKLGLECKFKITSDTSNIFLWLLFRINENRKYICILQ